MNTFSKLFCGIALAGMMFSCSNNDEPNMPGEESKGDFYSTLTLQLPRAVAPLSLPTETPTQTAVLR